MKFILGGVLEYRNADCRHHHIHEHDVTSSLKGKRKRPLDLFSSGFFLLEEYIKNSENDVDQREQCAKGNPPAPRYWKYLSQVFRQCDVYLFWPRNNSENVERRTHIPQTLNSMSVHMENTSVKGNHQRRILTGYEPWCLFTTTGVVRLAIDEVTTNVRIRRSVYYTV